MNLKKIRKEHNLTQAEVAKILQTSSVNYNRYENGLVQIDIQSLITLADYYHVSLDYLLDHKVKGNVDTSSFSDTKKGCVLLIDKLTEENATILLGYITHMTQTQNERRI